MANQIMYVSLVIAAVVIIGTAYYFMQYTSVTIPVTPNVTTPARQPSIVVSTQLSSGNQVVIDSFYLDQPGFVVIHREVNGTPGPVIGHSDVVSGEMTNFIVMINASQAGTKVFAMLHYDDNNNGAYDFPQEDKSIVIEGNVLVKPMEIVQQTTTPPVNKTNTTNVTTVSTKTFTIEADDSGFYMGGSSISSVQVNSSDIVNITFMVRSTNVYYGGLDFRSTKFNTAKVSSGGNTTVSFSADQTFSIMSYWPASGVQKANLQVIVS